MSGMSLGITSFYAGLIGLLFLVLSFRVVFHRITVGISHGSGDDDAFQRRVRIQANCAEYAPICLILIALAEAQGLPGWVLHLMGLSLLAGRVLHAYGMGSTPQIFGARKAGMILTFSVLFIGSLIGLCGIFW